MSTSATRIKNNYFDGLPVRKQHFWLFILIIVSYFFEQLDNGNFAFIAPALLEKGFITDNSRLAFITSLYFIGMTLGGFLGGIVSDAIGRRKSLIIAMFVLSAASVLNGLTSNFYVFTFARAATGFGIFMMMVTSYAYIAEMSPGESRGKWQSICAAGGFSAAPVIGLISRAVIPLNPEAYRIIFYIGALGFITAFLGIKYLIESPRWLVSKGRVKEAEECVKLVSGVDVDLSDVAKNAPPRISLVEQLIGMFTGKYLKRTIILLLIGVPLWSAAFGLTAWTPTLCREIGFSLKDSLTIGTAFMFGGPIGLLIFAPIADKGGRKLPMGIGLLIWAAFTIWFALSGNAPLALVMGLAFMLNACLMAITMSNNTYVPEHYPTRMRNTAVGVVNAVQRFGVSGSQLLIPVIMAGYGFMSVYLCIAALFVISAIFVLTLGQRTGGLALEEIE